MWRIRKRAPAARRLADLISGSLGGLPVVVVGPVPPRVLNDLAGLFPETEVLHWPVARNELVVRIATKSPLDAVLDFSRGRRRATTFKNAFYAVRAGGPYVVVDGQDELDNATDGLGKLLADGLATDRGLPVRQGSQRPAELQRRAIRNHLRAERSGPDLVLRHDLTDVMVAVPELMLNDLLPDGRHRLHLELPSAAVELPQSHEYPRPRRRNENLGIAAVPLSLREYRDVVVGPGQLVLDGRTVMPDSYRHHLQKTPRTKRLIPLSPSLTVPSVPVPRIGDLDRLEGTYLHLDNEARGHFGHLLTETISRAWTWPQALKIDPDARVLVGATEERPELLDYEVQIYEACGIDRDRIVLITELVQVERLISGTPMFSNPHYVHPMIAETWRTVGDHLAGTAPDRDWPSRIFVSRRTTRRACVNGAEVERVFVEAGFEIVFPEDYSLGEQVRMFRAAKVIAGYAGSGMFQIMFATEPKHVIEVGSEAYSPRNEYLIAAICRHRLDAIVCATVKNDPVFEAHPELAQMRRTGTIASFRYDEEREGADLRRLLESLDS